MPVNQSKLAKKIEEEGLSEKTIKGSAPSQKQKDEYKRLGGSATKEGHKYRSEIMGTLKTAGEGVKEGGKTVARAIVRAAKWGPRKVKELRYGEETYLTPEQKEELRRKKKAKAESGKTKYELGGDLVDYSKETGSPSLKGASGADKEELEKMLNKYRKK